MISDCRHPSRRHGGRRLVAALAACLVVLLGGGCETNRPCSPGYWATIDAELYEGLPPGTLAEICLEPSRFSCGVTFVEDAKGPLLVWGVTKEALPTPRMLSVALRSGSQPSTVYLTHHFTATPQRFTWITYAGSCVAAGGHLTSSGVQADTPIPDRLRR